MKMKKRSVLPCPIVLWYDNENKGNAFTNAWHHVRPVWPEKQKTWRDGP